MKILCQKNTQISFFLCHDHNVTDDVPGLGKNGQNGKRQQR